MNNDQIMQEISSLKEEVNYLKSLPQQGLRLRMNPGEKGFNLAGELTDGATDDDKCSFKIRLVDLTEKDKPVSLYSWSIDEKNGLRLEIVNGMLDIYKTGEINDYQTVSMTVKKGCDVKVSMANLLFDHNGKEPALIGADDARNGVTTASVNCIAADLIPSKTNTPRPVYIHFKAVNKTQGTLLLSDALNDKHLLNEGARCSVKELEIPWWGTAFDQRTIPC